LFDSGSRSMRGAGGGPVPADARPRYFLGVDGGGTGCRARLTDAKGRVLGQGAAGPANLALGLPAAVDAILKATHHALAEAGLNDGVLAQTRAGLGMAAANVPAHRNALESDTTLPFQSFVVCSDAEAACLGAHGGEDGGVLILGTGSQGVVLSGGRFTTVGGWGFAISDSGSGAMLGRAAVRRALLAQEGVEPESALTQDIMGHFDGDVTLMLDWSTRARPRDWAAFARVVFRYADEGDEVALSLVRASAAAVDRMLERMAQLGASKVSLMGGVAAPTRPYIAPELQSMIVEPREDAMGGALLLAHRAQCVERAI
jgi:glucosamine kinase